MDFSLSAIPVNVLPSSLDLAMDGIPVNPGQSGLTGFVTPSGGFNAQINADWLAVTGAAFILNKPNLAAVALSGSYSDLTGTPAAYVLPMASVGTLGGIKVGANLSIDGNGVLSAGNPYVLPISSATVLGGIKIGSGLSIDGTTGIVSVTASYSLPTASPTVLGGVKVGTGLAIDGSGVLSLSGGAGAYIQNQSASGQDAAFWLSHTLPSTRTRQLKFTDAGWNFIHETANVLLSGDGSNNFFMNAGQAIVVQTTAAQPIQFNINNVLAAQINSTGNFVAVNQVVPGSKTADPTGVAGGLYYNTTNNKLKSYINSVWENLATETYVQGALRTGTYIYVDTNHPSATDTRGTNSNYSLTIPWKTINAAFAALRGNDVLYVRAGTYSESVQIYNTINNLWNGGTIILDGCTINGGTVSSLGIVNFTVNLVMINANISNTGNAADRVNSAAFVNAGVVNINAIGSSSITSTQGHGVYHAANGVDTYSNVSITSTNGFGLYCTSTSMLNLVNCTVVSTNSTAIDLGYLTNMSGCTVTGGTYGVNYENGIPNHTWVNCTITGTANYAVANSAQGSGATTQKGVIYNCSLTGFSGILLFALGNTALNYFMQFDNCKFNVTNGGATAAFSLPAISGSSSFVKTTNTISNIQLYTSAYRATSEGIKVIIESNTNISTISAYYGVKVGLGQTVPTSQLDIQATNGYQQLRLRTQYTPTGSADTNGAAGDIAVDDNFIYFKASTGWKRATLATF